MAAGLGFKTFTTGEVLTAADVNGYLMQGILVFATEAARNSAITSPQEGQFAFTKDNNSLWYYTGSAWVASGATGDIEGVTAGVGISGGGTSGTVTITNDMATTITASGDIVVGTGSGTYDNLPIGSTGQVLTADTTVSPYKVKWATPASGSTFVGASAYKSTPQAITNNTQTAITWENEYFDTDGFHSTVSNTSRFTIPSGKGGKYLFTALGRFAANSTGIRSWTFYKNGASAMATGAMNAASTGGSVQTAVWTTSLVAGDYVELFCFQTSGGNLNINSDADESYITVTYLGA
jgi:hypothetical protein